MAALVPAPLLDLPSPWNRLDVDPRDSLVASGETRMVAVDVIDRCLQALDVLPHEDDEHFPEFITVAWSLWSRMFLDEMPTFDELRPEPIAEQFRAQDPSVSDALVRSYVLALVRKHASSLLGVVRGWLFDALRETPDPAALDALRLTLERWWRADQLFAEYALATVWNLDRAGSTDLVRRIAASPDASPALSARLTELLASSPQG